MHAPSPSFLLLPLAFAEPLPPPLLPLEQHLLPLAEAVSSLVPGAAPDELLALVRGTIAETIRACREEHPPQLQPGDAHRAAFDANLERTERALLLSPTVRPARHHGAGAGWHTPTPTATHGRYPQAARSPSPRAAVHAPPCTRLLRCFTPHLLHASHA